MGIIGKVCCDCIHYRHGDINDPCEKGQKKCGYLHVGCWMWKSENGKDVEMPTKVCSICGQELTIDHFYKEVKKPGGYSSACKSCFSYKDKRRKQKEKREMKEASIADIHKGVKVCNGCKRELPISQFNKNACTKDGFETKCKDCRKEIRKKNKAKQSHENRTNRC